MKPGSNYRIFAVAGMAAFAVLASYLLLYVSQGLQDGTDIPPRSANATIVVAKGIDIIDSGVTFNPPFIRTVIGHNDTVTWVNRNDTSITLEGLHGGYFNSPNFQNATLAPGESFSFTFGMTGMYQYHEKSSGKFGTVLVSTEELEESRLAPASPSILQKSPEEVARVMAKAVDPGDDVASLRLNNTRVVAYTTEKGADIIVPRLLCITCDQSSYHPLHYGSAPGRAAFPLSKNMDKLMNFTKGVMDAAGYRMDGSEHVDATNFGDMAHITIYQKVNGGWILPIPGARFTFMKDFTMIELGRWYESDSISSYRFGLGSDQARKVAEDFMDGEATRNPQIAKYGYRLAGAGLARVSVIDDKVMYIVPISYESTSEEYLDDKGHCGSPAVQTFEVMVDASAGRSFDWQLAACM